MLFSIVYYIIKNNILYCIIFRKPTFYSFKYINQQKRVRFLDNKSVLLKNSGWETLWFKKKLGIWVHK